MKHPHTRASEPRQEFEGLLRGARNLHGRRRSVLDSGFVYRSYRLPDEGGRPIGSLLAGRPGAWRHLLGIT